MSYIRIRKHYLHIPHLMLGLVELAAHFGSVWLIVALFSGGIASTLLLGSQWPHFLLFAVVLSCTSLAMGVFSALMLESYTNMVLRTLVSYFLLGSLAFSALHYLVPGFDSLEGAIAWATILSLLITLLLRWLFSMLYDVKELRRKVVVFGAGKRAMAILADIAKGEFRDIEVVGCFVENSHNTLIPENMRLALPGDWQKFLKDNSISEIILAQDERRRSQGAGFPLNEFLFAKLGGIHITEDVSFFERGKSKLELPQLRTSWMLFSDGFNSSRIRDWSKRVFDLVLCSALLVIFLPIMVPTALAVFLGSGRPILYSQTRVGLNGRKFRIYKFRSMRKDAEKDGKAIWAQKNDNRVTRVGAFIRNTRLDELPQLMNVIRGDMSFVGPRPERPEFVDELNKKVPYYAVRHTVKPGLMGWAQLKYPYGASEEDAKNKLEYDLYYTKNHSFFMDVLIVIQTVEVVLLGKGVH